MRRFLPCGSKFYARHSKSSQHYAGGSPIHAAAKCRCCKRELTLLWNLDLSDSLFGAAVRDGFHPDSRLALYICWNCMVTAYRQDGPKLTVFQPDHYWDHLTQDESPHADSPNILPSRRIGFQKINSTVDGLRTLADTIGLDRLDKEGIALLSAHYGQPLFSPSQLPYSQLGGGLVFLQGHRNLTCPNKRCPASKLEHPFGDLQVDFLMKELATISLDAEPVLEASYFQIDYHICWVCFSIRAQYACT